MKRDKELIDALVARGYVARVGPDWKWTDKGYLVSGLLRLAIERKINRGITPKGMDMCQLEEAGFNPVTCMPL